MKINKTIIFLLLAIVAVNCSAQKIIKENKNMTAENLFIKIGTHWNVDLANDEGRQWRYNIKPTKGLRLIDQFSMHEENRAIDDGSYGTIEYGKEDVATSFEFIAEKAGKYVLTFENGFRQHTEKLNVLTEKEFNTRAQQKIAATIEYAQSLLVRDMGIATYKAGDKHTKRFYLIGIDKMEKISENKDEYYLLYTGCTEGYPLDYTNPNSNYTKITEILHIIPNQDDATVYYPDGSIAPHNNYYFETMRLSREDFFANGMIINSEVKENERKWRLGGGSGDKGNVLTHIFEYYIKMKQQY